MENAENCVDCGIDLEDLYEDEVVQGRCAECEDARSEDEWYASCEMAEARHRGDIPDQDDPFTSTRPDYWIDPESGEYRLG